MLALKYVSLSFLAGFLLAGCAHRDHNDSMLRQQIVGTWSQSPSAAATFLPNGRFHSDVRYADSDARIDGTWDVERGALVISTTHSTGSYRPSATHIESVSGSPNPTFHKILAVDATWLTVLTEDLQMGARTNLWKRK